MNYEAEMLRLSPEAIRALPPGPDMDRLVAGCVMSHTGGRRRRQFSSDANDALELVKDMELECGHSAFFLGGDGWNINFTNDDPDGLVIEPDPGAFCVAVCRAALLELYLVVASGRQLDLDSGLIRPQRA